IITLHSKPDGRLSNRERLISVNFLLNCVCRHSHTPTR
ncbi:Hypothetical predicted protein, partial [Cloeon dipterum]